MAMQNIIDQTVIIVENELDKRLSDKVITELNTLLEEYLHENLTSERKLFNAGCWGGGVFSSVQPP